MFSAEARSRVQGEILARARSDDRIVAGALVGSTAEGTDRWSDLDLTFGLAPGTDLEGVLADWTEFMRREFGALVLFDLPHLSTIYRVFLLKGDLQVDLSFTPSREFGALGPRFKLLFGQSVERNWNQPPTQQSLLGHAVHHLLRARICIERERLWQAEYWLSLGRGQALELACVGHGVDAGNGRGFDKLPKGVLQRFEGTYPDPRDRHALLSALGRTIDALILLAKDVPGAKDLEGRLHVLKSDPLA